MILYINLKYPVKTNHFMLIRSCLLIVIWIFMPESGVSGHQQESPCETFYEALSKIPHRELTWSSDNITEIGTDKESNGCDITFITDNTLMKRGFRAISDWIKRSSDIYRSGWRLNENFVADGPGSISFRLERNSRACDVREDWSHSNGQEELLIVEVQCRKIGADS